MDTLIGEGSANLWVFQGFAYPIFGTLHQHSESGECAYCVRGAGAFASTRADGTTVPLYVVVSKNHVCCVIE